MLQLPKVGIHFYKNVERFIINYEKLSEISKDDNSRNTDILWKLSCLIYPTAPAWNGTMQLVHHSDYPYQSSITFSANDRYGSYKCIVDIFDATLCCNMERDMF